MTGSRRRDDSPAMLSLSKLLLIVLVAAAVFYAFKLLRPKVRRPVARRAGPRALDMRKCAVCGVFVGEGEGTCGKPGCPTG